MNSNAYTTNETIRAIKSVQTNYSRNKFLQRRYSQGSSKSYAQYKAPTRAQIAPDNSRIR